MRILFLGSPDFAIPSLNALINAKHEIVAVFTQPDRPAGRGAKIQETPVKLCALGHNLKVYTPETCKSDETYELMKSLNFELGVVIAYGNILPQRVLDIPPKGFINAHGSLLPLYRGASPISAPILNGDKISGISIQKMVKKVDAGDVLLSMPIELSPDETTESLHDKLSHLASIALVKVCEEIHNNTIVATPQDETKATFAGKLNKDMGKINWAESAEIIDRKIRAFTPWPGTYCFIKIANELTRVKIIKATPAENINCNIPGKIISNNPFNFVVGTGNGALRILELQRDGKKIQDTATFLNGNRLNFEENWQ